MCSFTLWWRNHISPLYCDVNVIPLYVILREISIKMSSPPRWWFSDLQCHHFVWYICGLSNFLTQNLERKLRRYFISKYTMSVHQWLMIVCFNLHLYVYIYYINKCISLTDICVNLWNGTDIGLCNCSLTFEWVWLEFNGYIYMISIWSCANY